MSTIKSNNVQLGQSVTATNNFTWYQPASPDGTVRLGNGNAGSVTDLVTLTSAGNLGIGTSSPGYKLDVNGPIRAYNSDNWNYSNLNLVRNASNTATPRFVAFMLDGDSNNNTTIGGYPAIWGIYSGTPTTGSTSSGLSAKMGLASYAGFNYYINGTQAMTLDASGLGIGQTSVVNRLDVLSSGSYSAVVDMTTAQMRLKHATFPVQLYAGLDHVNRFAYMQASETGVGYRDLLLQPAGGNLLVGTTSAAGKLSVTQTTASQTLAWLVGTSSAKLILDYQANGIFYADSNEVQFRNIAGNLKVGISAAITGGATTLSVDANGYIIRTPSDRNLKTNDKAIPYGLAEVNKMRPIIHEWVPKANMGDGKSIGFIAQEMEEIIPEVVSGEETKSLDYPKLVAVLTAAIQELSAEIETLKQRIK